MGVDRHWREGVAAVWRSFARCFSSSVIKPRRRAVEIRSSHVRSWVVPGPRVPFGPQKVELLDEVLWFFPELRVVTRHGCEPWTDVAWKLMLKYPNLQSEN